MTPLEPRPPDESVLHSRELRPAEAPPADASRAIDTAGAPVAPPAASPETFVGRDLGGYRLEEFVGAGGFSMAFRATRIATGEVVAVKLPRVESFVAHLQREALISSRFRDPQVVPILDLRLDHNPPFLVMPFIPGENLSLPDSAPPPWEQIGVLKRFRSIVEVVARLHAADIAHGDLKPGNIRFDPGDPALWTWEFGIAFHPAASCHLLDFGIARHQVAARQLSTLRASVMSVTGRKIAGTLAFMAPEIMAGQPPSKAADVYALGVLLHHMLCGRPPAFGVSPDELNPYLPPGAVAFLRDMLAHDPLHRIPDASTLARDIDCFIDSERRCLSRKNGHERRLVLTERMRTLARGLRVLAVAAVVVLFVVFAVRYFATADDAPIRASRRDDLTLREGWMILALPFAVVACFLCLLLAMTTINAWILGVPERLYKNRRGHAWWSFMMQ